MTKGLPREKQIVEAYMLISQANHYMVGFVEKASLPELREAHQYLILVSNVMGNGNEMIERALDTIERDIKSMSGE